MTEKLTYKGHLFTFNGSKKKFSFTSYNPSLDKMDVMEKGAKSSKCKLDNIMDCVFMKVTDNPDNSGRILTIWNEVTDEERTLPYNDARELLEGEDSEWLLGDKYGDD